MQDLTFSKIAEEWLEWTGPQIKESSRSRYISILNNHLLPEFGTQSVTKISRSGASSFQHKLLTTGGKDGTGLSKKSVSIIFAVLRDILDYSEHVKGIKTNDLGRIGYKQPVKPFRVLNLNEQKLLSSYLLKDPTLIHLGILLSLYTGLRIGEVCALKWNDISLTEGDIFIHTTLQRIQTFDERKKTQVIIAEPKSISSIRHIPLPLPLLEPLSHELKPGNCFFLTGTPDRFVEPRTLENHYNAVMRTLNITGTTFHTCRHTFATRCVEFGFDVKSLSEILGHANVSITMNRYVHPSMEYKRENMQRLSGLITPL